MRSAVFTEAGGFRFTLGRFSHGNWLRLQPLRRERMVLSRWGRESLGPSRGTSIHDGMDLARCSMNLPAILVWKPKFTCWQQPTCDSLLSIRRDSFATNKMTRSHNLTHQSWIPSGPSGRGSFGFTDSPGRVCCRHAGLHAGASWAVAAGSWVLVVWDQCSHRLPRPPKALCLGDSKRWGGQVQGTLCVCVKQTCQEPVSKKCYGLGSKTMQD